MKIKNKPVFYTFTLLLAAGVIWIHYVAYAYMHKHQSVSTYCGIVQGKFMNKSKYRTEPTMGVRFDAGPYKELNVTLGTYENFNRGDKVCFEKRYMDVFPTYGLPFNGAVIVMAIDLVAGIVLAAYIMYLIFSFIKRITFEE